MLSWFQSRDRVRDAMFSIELWYEAIRTIEGQFGSAVGSYFRMVRRLFTLNLALAALWVFFVVVPQALHNDVTLNNASGANWVLDWITGKVRLSGAVTHSSTLPTF